MIIYIIHFFLKLSFTETNPTFSDYAKYNGFYRMVPSEEQHNYIRLDLIRKFNWTRVGTIYLTKAKYTLVKIDLFLNFFIYKNIDKTKFF